MKGMERKYTLLTMPGVCLCIIMGGLSGILSRMKIKIMEHPYRPHVDVKVSLASVSADKPVTEKNLIRYGERDSPCQFLLQGQCLDVSVL